VGTTGSRFVSCHTTLSSCVAGEHTASVVAALQHTPTNPPLTWADTSREGLGFPLNPLSSLCNRTQPVAMAGAARQHLPCDHAQLALPITLTVIQVRPLSEVYSVVGVKAPG
jgi:hypothetical protein